VHRVPLQGSSLSWYLSGFSFDEAGSLLAAFVQRSCSLAGVVQLQHSVPVCAVAAHSGSPLLQRMGLLHVQLCTAYCAAAKQLHWLTSGEHKARWCLCIHLASQAIMVTAILIIKCSLEHYKNSRFHGNHDIGPWNVGPWDWHTAFGPSSDPFLHPPRRPSQCWSRTQTPSLQLRVTSPPLPLPR
jgi:hypothetical protein